MLLGQRLGLHAELARSRMQLLHPMLDLRKAVRVKLEPLGVV